MLSFGLAYGLHHPPKPPPPAFLPFGVGWASLRHTRIHGAPERAAIRKPDTARDTQVSLAVSFSVRFRFSEILRRRNRLRTRGTGVKIAFWNKMSF